MTHSLSYNTLVKNSQILPSLKSNYRTKTFFTFFLQKTFKTYVSLTYFTQKNHLPTHASMVNLYFTNSHKGSTFVTNTSKFFTLYSTSLTFIKDLFFYKIKIIFFGTPLFKHEIRAFNTLLLKNTTLNSSFGTSSLLLGVLPLIRRSFNLKLLQFFKQINLNTSFISDVFYHKTAINYLRKVGILTTGLVPITSHISTLDIVVPLPTDSVFLQVFMFKLLIHVKQLTEHSRYINALSVFRKK